MLRSKHIAVMMLAVGLSGCGGYAMYESSTAASFNGSNGSAEWRNAAATPTPDPSGSESSAPASQAPAATATADPSASKAKTANTSLSARASEAKVEAKPLDPIGALANSTQDVPTNSTSASAPANSTPANAIPAAAPASAVAKPVEPTAAIEKVAVEPHGRAYLFRGIAGLIYSRGMDRLADRINRAGIKATVNTYLVWRVICDAAIRDYRRDPQPITIIGHSAGGDSAMAFAEVLNAADIPVSLLVTYDPTRIADSVAPNVERYINIFQSRNMLGGGDVVQGRGFHGNYASYNLSWHSEIIHMNIEKAEHPSGAGGHQRSPNCRRRQRRVARVKPFPFCFCRSRRCTDRTLGQRHRGVGACR